MFRYQDYRLAGRRLFVRGRGDREGVEIAGMGGLREDHPGGEYERSEEFGTRQETRR